jgi:Tfp pilus assembly protein PilX
MNARVYTNGRERGSALIIGLVLLAVITLLAVAGMNASTMDLQVASNVQSSQGAFQASERALTVAMNTTMSDTTQAALVVPEIVAPGTADRYKYTVRFNATNGITEVPSGGFSLGEGVGFKAYHFDVTATGTSSRDASTTTTQSYYVVGPSGG